MSTAMSTTAKIKGYCVQCGSLCPAIFHVKDGIFIKAEPDREHPNSNPLCPKGAAAPELVYDKQRLRYPMRRTRPKGEPDPGWERITWDDALDTVASRLNEIKAEFGPEAVVFNRSGPGGSPSSDFNDWVSRLAHAFGTPNVLATGHVCQWHRDTGSTYTYGRGGIGVPEFEQAACILIWGTNPQATSRTRHRAIQRAQARGAKLIVIDPRHTETAARADLWLQIRPGTDGALALSMINTLIEEELYDSEFTSEWTTAPFLVRRDNGDLLRAGELSGKKGQPGYVVWDTASQSPKAYDAASLKPALKGTYTVTLASGEGLVCDTVFERLTELSGQYPAGRGAEICGVAEEQIKQAARMLAT
ncbi:MAG: molybdopterin-dependent oxidoreductase, partial [Dehalococcoidia bacterium]